MSGFLKSVYSKIASRYERVNHIFSFGLDILWRKELVRMVVAEKPSKVLDVCTGTGETARYIEKFSQSSVDITGTDFSEEMLCEARKHAGANITYKRSDTSSLPFDNETFDAVTISFATRNLNSGDKPLAEYFTEIRRVIKNGGTFYNLETSQPKNALIRFFFRAYVKALVALIGYKFSGHEEGYKYLASSILSFMTAEELAKVLKDSGFRTVSFKRLFFGAAAIHTAIK